MQKLIEKIKQKIRQIGNIQFSSYTKLLIAVDDVIKIIDQVAEEYSVVKNDGWIPVISERFPDTDDYILLSFSNFSIPLVGRWEADEEGGAFFIGDETESCVSQGIIVNAWRPLPTRYQEA